jgi:hypothetical protein
VHTQSGLGLPLQSLVALADLQANRPRQRMVVKMMEFFIMCCICVVLVWNFFWGGWIYSIFWEWEIGDINPILGDAGLIFIQFFGNGELVILIQFGGRGIDIYSIFWEWEIGDINPIWGTRD